MNRCTRCNQPALYNLKEDRSIWFCIAHGMEYSDIKSGKYSKTADSK